MVRKISTEEITAIGIFQDLILGAGIATSEKTTFFLFIDITY